MEQCREDIIHQDAVDKVQAEALDPMGFQSMLVFYKAIADETRLKILVSLTSHELCVCDLAYIIGKSKSAISHQLRYLREANSVKSRKEGRNVFYSLIDNHVVDIIENSKTHIQESEEHHVNV